MKLQAAVDDFLLAGRADGLATATQRWYASLLSALVGQLPGDGLPSTRALRAYIVSLRERGLSESSVASHITALHAFFSWVSREYSIDNPMRNIKRAKRPHPTPKALAVGDFARLLQATGDDTGGVRDRALLCFLADTGCRLGGLTRLKLEHLERDLRRALVIEKGGKSRMVYYTYYTARLLDKWLFVRRSDSPNVFVSTTGGRPLTESGVTQVLKRLKKRAGVQGRVNAHAFRHNFAREYIRSGGDVVTLARLLGHKDIRTTADYYAVFSPDELGEFHDKHTPIRKMRGK